MFGLHSTEGYHRTLPGIRIKAINSGANMIMTEFLLDKGTLLPEHTHPHEQSGYLVSGRLRFTIEESTRVVEPGDSWCVPGGVKHKAEVLEDSKAVEVFAPLREEYLQYINTRDIKD